MRSIPSTAIVSYADNDLGQLVEGAVSSVPGTGLPTTASTYAVGARIVDISTGYIYINVGTVAAPVWMSSADTIQYKQLNLTAADIVATTAGSLSHANGLTLVAAPAAGFALELVSCVVSYTFATAAFTGGGNVSVNWGAGGAAITGVATAANSFTKASSNINQFVPLATAGNNIVSAAALSLVTASAITQPGTAAGTAKIHVRYAVHAL